MVDAKLAGAYGTLAGFGFIGVALLALPSTRLLDPQPAPEAYLLTLLGLVTGLTCFAVPWERFDPRWLHVIGVTATVETAATVAVFGTPYVAFYFLIAVLVAYVAPDSRTLGVQLGLITLALLGPVAYGPEDARTSLSVALVVAPALVLTAGLFSYLRLKMVHDRRAYHRFAEQTLVLSSQIAGRQLGPIGLVPQPEPVPRLSRVRPPTRAIAAVAFVLGIPLFAGGLAAAGVRLPDLASDPFERVGIELPNQGADGPEPPAGSAAQGREPGTARRADAARKADPPRAASAAADAAGPVQADAGETGPAEAPSATSSAPAPAATDPAPPLGTDPRAIGGGGGQTGKSPVDGLLDDATSGIKGILDDLRAGR